MYFIHFFKWIFCIQKGEILSNYKGSARYKFVVLFSIFALVVVACGDATEEEAEVVEETTEAPAEEPAAEPEAEGGEAQEYQDEANEVEEGGEVGAAPAGAASP